MIFVFVIDTGASMNQVAANGMSLLDCSKAAVEHFLKIRGRDPQAMRNDRYMLVTCEDAGPSGAANIKAGWKSPFSTFVEELKNLQARDLSNVGQALKTAFDLLNQYRLQTGIDNYGIGRHPRFQDPSLVVLLTDGHASSPEGVVKHLCLPLQPAQVGSELTREPFRWDERLFSLVLRFPSSLGTPGAQARTGATAPLPSLPPGTVVNALKEFGEDEEITGLMSKVTGGRCYRLTEMRELLQCMEVIISKAQPGVVVALEKYDPENLLATQFPHMKSREHTTEAEDTPMAEAEHSGGGDNGRGTADGGDNGDVVMGEAEKNPLSSSGGKRSTAAAGVAAKLTAFLPPATLYSMIMVRPNSPGFWPLPEDYYLDPNSAQLLARSAHPHILYTPRDSSSYIMKGFPFDKYPIEHCELTEFMCKHKKGVSWPVYISGSSPNSLLPFGFVKASASREAISLFVLPLNYPRLWPLLDEFVNVLKFNPTPKWRNEFEQYLATLPFYYMKPLKNALKRFGIAMALIPDHFESELPFTIQAYLKKLKEQSKVEADRMLAAMLQAKENSRSRSAVGQTSALALARQSLATDANGEGVAEAAKKGLVTDSKFKNAFDISRGDLLEHLQRMRVHVFERSTAHDEGRHALPINQMGNYQEAMMSKQLLRDIWDEEDSTRRPIFGNPFRSAKSPRMDSHFVDETESEEVTGAGAGGGTGGLGGNNGGGSGGVAGKKRKSSPQQLEGAPKQKLTKTEAKNPLIVGLFSAKSHGDANGGSGGHSGTNGEEKKRVKLPSSGLGSSSPPPHISGASPPRGELKRTKSDMGAIVADAAALQRGRGVPNSPSRLRSPAKEGSANGKSATEAELSRLSPLERWQSARDCREFNLSLKTGVVRMLRKSIPDNKVVFQKLRLLRGSLQDREEVIRQILTSAKRYQKSRLVGAIQMYLAALLEAD